MASGACLCGAVRYEVEADPEITAVCHCTHCQRQGGSAFSLVVAVPIDKVHVSGTPATFEDVGDSGQPVRRRYCSGCGSPILSEIAATPGLAWLKAGTLDDTSSLTPTMQIFCASKQPWVDLAGLESFPAMPPL